MPKCDICGEDFDTERGLHIHQSQKHDEEKEDVETEEVEESDSGDDAEDASPDDEVVREIEEETAGGLLGSFSRESLVVGGALLGIAIGLGLGLFLSQGSGLDKPSNAEIESKIEGLPGVNLNVSSVTMKHGLYQANITREMSFGNRTVSRTIQQRQQQQQSGQTGTGSATNTTQ
ncbi:MAG: hypothetical protein ABEK04_01920 [Candidatus Nanohalobium sp.]